MKVIVAVTAASGALYARLTLESLLRSADVEQIALIYSTHAREILRHEGVVFPEDPRIKLFNNEDFFASPASGSASWDAMAVVPCSVGTAGRIASGISQSLLERAADVMLKERRKLVLIVRESPLSLIHLRNLTALTEGGAVILPAAPSFYSQPSTVEELCMTVVERLMVQLGVRLPHFEWSGR